MCWAASRYPFGWARSGGCWVRMRGDMAGLCEGLLALWLGECA